MISTIEGFYIDTNYIETIYNQMVIYAQKQLDIVFGALSDGTRREILNSLAGGDHTVLELVEMFEMSQPAVTKHLNLLVEAGLIEKRKDGRYRHCKLQTGSLRVASRWIENVRQFWEDSFGAIDAYTQDGEKSVT